MAYTPEGLDPTHALVAPGQGSQRVGMGYELAQKSPAAAEVWKECDKILYPSRGYNFSELVWQGSEDELRRTENAQPAIIIGALARKAVLEEAGLYDNPMYHTGMSLGAIVALVTAGVIDFRGAALLGEARGKAVGYAVANNPEPTTMIAIQNDDPQVVEQLVEDLTTRYSLNKNLLNTFNQVVLGGKLKDVLEAKEYLTKQDPRLGEQQKILPVAAAFHDPSMEPAVPIYIDALKSIDMQPPSNGILLIGSVISPLRTVLDIKYALANQLVQPERYRELIRFLANHGVTRITELNEVPTLSDMNRRLLGGNRTKIIFPNGTDPQGKDITLVWRWQGVSIPSQATEISIAKDQKMQEAEELLKKYATIDDMEHLLELDAPKTYEGILLWYRKWTAIRTGKNIEEVRTDGDFVIDSGIDSLDYSVLRADVQGKFGRLVDEKEAKENVTPELAAKATWRLLNAS